MRHGWLVLATLVGGGCARVVIDDGAITCLSWRDEDHAVEDAPPSEGLVCDPLVPGAQGGKVIPNGTYTRTDVCTGLPEDGSACPSGAAIADRFRPCLESYEGEACGPSFGGACSHTFMWSLCGPDPAADGGCCYEALVVTSTWLE